MTIDEKDPLKSIKEIFTFFQGIRCQDFKYNDAIPRGLQELYSIHDSNQLARPGNTLFSNQDPLILPDKVDLQKQYFTFLIENQSSWKCETEKNSLDPAVYIYDAVYLDGREKIENSLNSFLTTYALMELTFDLAYSINNSFEKEAYLSKGLKVQELWMNKPYTWGEGNRYSFWLIEDNCILMDCSITYFATTDKDKFEYIKSVVEK